MGERKSQKTIADLEGVALRKVSETERTLSALVSDISRESGYESDRVIEELMQLQSKRKITLAEKKPYASLSSFVLSPNSLWFWGVVTALLLSLGLVLVTGGLALYLRYFFESLLVVFLPGYSLVELLYPKRELDELMKVLLSIGLSLILVSFVGLVLNYTPYGIRLFPVVFSLAGLTTVLLIMALTRKHAYYKVAKDLDR